MSDEGFCRSRAAIRNKGCNKQMMERRYADFRRRQSRKEFLVLMVVLALHNFISTGKKSLDDARCIRNAYCYCLLILNSNNVY